MMRKKKMTPNGRTPLKQEQFTKLYHGMVNHPNFRMLSGAALKVLMYLCGKHNGFNNGQIAASYDEMAKELYMGKATAYRSCDELEYYGFIKLMKKGQFFGHRANEWELTFVNSASHARTDDWKPAKKKFGGRTRKVKVPSLVDETIILPEYAQQRAKKIEARY